MRKKNEMEHQLVYPIVISSLASIPSILLLYSLHKPNACSCFACIYSIEKVSLYFSFLLAKRLTFKEEISIYLFYRDPIPTTQ